MWKSIASRDRWGLSSQARESCRSGALGPDEWAFPIVMILNDDVTVSRKCLLLRRELTESGAGERIGQRGLQQT